MSRRSIDYASRLSFGLALLIAMDRMALSYQPLDFNFRTTVDFLVPAARFSFEAGVLLASCFFIGSPISTVVINLYVLAGAMAKCVMGEGASAWGGHMRRA